MQYNDIGSFKGPRIEVLGLVKELNEQFPWLQAGYQETEEGATLAQASIGAASLVGASTQIERIPNNPDGQRENVAEHTQNLSTIAVHFAKVMGLHHLGTNKIEDFARVHDLLELKVGDKNTFNLTPQELEEKEKAEHAGLEELLQELPGWLADALQEYERQDTEEARFVRAIDKLLPLSVNIAHEDLTVVRRDFDITTSEELRHAHRSINQGLAGRFGEKWLKTAVIAHAIECLIYEDIYEKKSSGAIEDKRDPAETKRRFLINPKDLPHDLDSNPNILREDIRQFYPNGHEDGSSTRVRCINDTVVTILKRSKGTIQRLKGEEIVLDGMTVEVFDKWHESSGAEMVAKTKYSIPFGKVHTIELGIYHGSHDGLMLAAIKFNGRDALAKSNLIEIPSWFGEEVTSDPRYFGHRIGEDGIPDIAGAES